MVNNYGANILFFAFPSKEKYLKFPLSWQIVRKDVAFAKSDVAISRSWFYGVVFRENNRHKMKAPLLLGKSGTFVQ